MITKTSLILKKDVIINLINLNNKPIIFLTIRIIRNLILIKKRTIILNTQRNNKEIH
jgi:hypothetical protein